MTGSRLLPTLWASFDRLHGEMDRLLGDWGANVPRAADGYIPLENFERLIDERTLLVAVTHVCFRNGARLDIPGIVRLAHARGARECGPAAERKGRGQAYPHVGSGVEGRLVQL